MRFVVMAVLVGACSPQGQQAPAAAEAPEAKPAVVLIEEYDADVLVRIAQKMGFSPGKRTEGGPDARASIELVSPDGPVIVAEERHCASHTPGVKCAGITLTGRIVFDAPDRFDRVAHANEFNQEQAAVAMFAEGKDIFVSDDLILDGGVTEANLAAALQAFSTVLHQHRTYLDGMF